MRNELRFRLVVVVIFSCLNGAEVLGQESDAGWQARPALTASIELGPHSRFQAFGRFESGLNYSYRRLRAGAAFSYRMKRILKPHRTDIDEENEHNLVFSGGYEYLERTENNEISREHRISFDGTPRYLLGAGFLAADRNRVELRWVNGVYNVRYRNRLVIGRPLDVNGLRLTPYATGEIFYDRNLHSWNRTQYGFGVQFPGRGRFMVDTFYLHENCSGCSRSPVNICGVSLNLYFKRND